MNGLAGMATADAPAWEPLAIEKGKKLFEMPRPLAPLMDTHAHLRSFWKLDAATALQRAAVAGVRALITLYDPIADATTETPDAAAFGTWLCAQAADVPSLHIRYLVGVHPYGAGAYTDDVHAQIERALSAPWCVGIGEIGLDYHIDADDALKPAPRELQMEVMARQLALAHAHNVPVELHLRNDAGDTERRAHADAVQVLSEVGVPAAGCVLHCFGEDTPTMERFVALGCHIAFGGAATFKRNEVVRSAFSACPLERLLLETDCPYMAPEPVRGVECEPALVAQTADMLIYDRADRTGELPVHIAEAVWETSNALFGGHDE